MEKSLSDSINSVLRKSLGKKSNSVAEIVINWEKIVGRELAQQTSPGNIYSTKENGKKIGILYVSVDSAATGLKLAYQQELIIEKIAIYFGHKLVHKIRSKINLR